MGLRRILFPVGQRPGAIFVFAVFLFYISICLLLEEAVDSS